MNQKLKPIEENAMTFLRFLCVVLSYDADQEFENTHLYTCACYMLASVFPLRLLVAPLRNPRLATLLVLLASPLWLPFSCVVSTPSCLSLAAVSVSSRRSRGLALSLIRLATKSPKSALRLLSEVGARSSSRRPVRLGVRVGEFIWGNIPLGDRVGVRLCEFSMRDCNFMGDTKRSLGGVGGRGRDKADRERARGSRSGESSSLCEYTLPEPGVECEILSGVGCGDVWSLGLFGLSFCPSGVLTEP